MIHVSQTASPSLESMPDLLRAETSSSNDTSSSNPTLPGSSESILGPSVPAPVIITDDSSFSPPLHVPITRPGSKRKNEKTANQTDNQIAEALKRRIAEKPKEQLQSSRLNQTILNQSSSSSSPERLIVAPGRAPLNITSSDSSSLITPPSSPPLPVLNSPIRNTNHSNLAAPRRIFVTRHTPTAATTGRNPRGNNKSIHGG
jgi:hypothetical protein